MKRIIGFVVTAIVLLLTVGCSSQVESIDKKVIIAEQFGLAYAPLQIMKDKGYLDEELTDYEIEWVKLGNTTAIREAILADELDVGFLGIPPFLIGYDNGMEWGIFTGLSSSPLGLVSNDSSIKSLADISQTDRIALPQPGSIQHILLSMAAEREFGKSDYFDNQLVTMNHPDGMNALLSGSDIKLHYTSPPFLFEELKSPDLSIVIDGEECFSGDFTFIVGMTTKKFKENEVAYNALKESVSKAIQFMNDNPDETVEILCRYYDYDKETMKNYLYEQGIIYSTEVKGTEKFIEFMIKNSLLKQTISIEDIIW